MRSCVPRGNRDHPDVERGVLASALRWLDRSEARPFARAFLDTIQMADLRSPAGLYVGRVGTYWVDAERLCNVVARVIRGLFFHHVGEPLGADYELKVFEDIVACVANADS